MMSPVKISLIVARAKNGVIGVEGDLPWRLKADLAFFKATTLGKPILMGRNTWESLPRRPLPKRDNIVLTRDWTYAAEGARVYASYATAAAAARAIATRAGQDEAFVIGGEALYTRAIATADRMYITEVDAAPKGDAFFPAFDESEWSEQSAVAHSADDDNDHAFVMRTLVRKTA